MAVNDYLIVSSDSTKTIRISSEGITDDKLSIPLVGYFWDGYGEFIAQAQLQTLENFNNSSPPPLPIEGQLWYDSGEDKLKVYKSSGDWSIVGASPEIELNDLNDVSIGIPQEGNFLRYDQGLWRNQNVQFRFTDLTDTPSERRPNAYIRSNASQTALVYFDKFNAATDFVGDITFEQLSRGDTLQQLCQWIKDNNCIPEPLPPAFLIGSHQGGSCTTQVGTSCTATGSLTAEIQNPESTTPPYSYTWTKVDGTTLDGGTIIRVTGVSNTSRTITTQLTATAENLGSNNFTSRYRVTVSDATSQQIETLEPVAAATYTIVGTEPPQPILSNARHVGGTCSSPPNTSCTANGFGSINFNATSTNSTGPYTYRWIVNDGSPLQFIPEDGGTPRNSTITTTPFVQTSLTRPVPSPDESRTFAVSVRGTVGGQPDTIIASAQMPSATYSFTEGAAPLQDYTLRIFLDGQAQTTASPSGFRGFFENFVIIPPPGGIAVQEGKETFVVITRSMTRPNWRLLNVSGCDSNGTLEQEDDNRWVYSFTMPSNDCIVQIDTEEIVDETPEQPAEYKLTTVVPSGFTISPAYPNGANIEEGDEVVFTITQQNFARNLTGVSGCGGSLSPSPSPTEFGPWTYTVTMPSADCTVTVTDVALPSVVASSAGSCDDDTSAFPIFNPSLCSGPFLNFIDAITLSPASLVSGTGGSGTYNIFIVPNSLVDSLNITSGSAIPTIVGNTVDVSINIPDVPSGTTTATLSGSVTVTVRVEDALNPSNFDVIPVTCAVGRAWTCTAPP